MYVYVQDGNGNGPPISEIRRLFTACLSPLTHNGRGGTRPSKRLHIRHLLPVLIHVLLHSNLDLSDEPAAVPCAGLAPLLFLVFPEFRRTLKGFRKLLCVNDGVGIGCPILEHRKHSKLRFHSPSFSSLPSVKNTKH